MNKVVILGIDGLDPILVNKWRNELPNLKKLKEHGDQIEYESIFPYDSIPLWASIYTGLNPSKHGILGSPINFLEKDYSSNINVDFIKGKTFWDYASSNGKKVCIVNPFLAYPPWKVNGVMASGSVFDANLPQKEFPSDVSEKFKVPYLGGVLSYTGYPTKENLNKFKDKIFEMSINQAEFSLDLLKSEEWDLFFTCFITLDGLQHFFWRYCDEKDPTYPGKNQFEGVILDIYKKFDEIIGKMKKSSPDATFIILSDHGFGMRCIKLFNSNELLRKNNLLFLKDNKSRIIEKLKFKVFDLISNLNMENLALKIAKKIPKITKNAQKSSDIFDMNRTIAYTADLTGMNPCGGINIIKSNLKDLDYENVRSLIINKMEQVENSGEKVVNWVYRREDLYDGKKIEEFPDIIFELKEEYGVNWAINTALVTNAYTHKVVSGGHKKKAFFLVENLNREKVNDSKIMTTLDIAPTILDILDIDLSEHIGFEGNSILK